jgi:hypothetical protein
MQVVDCSTTCKPFVSDSAAQFTTQLLWYVASDASESELMTISVATISPLPPHWWILFSEAQVAVSEEFAALAGALFLAEFSVE